MTNPHTSPDRADSVELLACPFCGGAAEYRWHSSPECWIECTKCFAVGPNDADTTTEQHRAAWNTRLSAEKSAHAEGWRDIASAPKDGTWIVGYGNPSPGSPEGPYVTRWAAYGKGSPAYASWERGEGDQGTFWHYEPVSNWTNGWQPTRWTPLPSATPNEPRTAGVEALREALSSIIAHFDPHGTDGNAPGHAHARPGIWDNDAGNDAAGLSNLPCEWCATWNAARATLSTGTGGGA